ncbi:kinesin-like protein KIF26B isoform X2 [Centruroides sculpturatus]|uniref:kinesin-like protein KIF26B isoform X2 n=1 Tax=Centruroides sculpturatus TaxID=218467 RepID=UPI000C6DD6A5|nr:kinesin-like protein KIF26B isoform X2 [Centruroides sculpturatus]
MLCLIRFNSCHYLSEEMVQFFQCDATKHKCDSCPSEVSRTTSYLTTYHHVHHHLHHRTAKSFREYKNMLSCGMLRIIDDNRMSRQVKAAGTNPSVPSPVAQQAQKYLEQNIKAWMKPKPQGQMLFPSPVTPTGHSLPRTNSPNQQDYNSSKQTMALLSHTLAATGGYPPPTSSYFSHSSTSAVCYDLPTNTIPHSLSFSGYSHHSLLQGTSFSSPCASSYDVIQQPSAAASFFARAAQRLNLSSKKRRRHQTAIDGEVTSFITNFYDVIRATPPPAPPCLFRTGGRKDSVGIGKVKVMVRVCPAKPATDTSSTFLNIDSRKKQIIVYDPSSCGLSTPAERRVGVSAPKIFAFDAIYSPDETQTEVCSSSLTEVIQAVVNGNDGCLFVYGHSKLGKSYTMIGGSQSAQHLGIIPCAITWLFKLIAEQKQKIGARFSVRVSAVELTGRNEVLKDLLADQASGTEGSGTSPGVYLRDDPVFGTQLMNHSELRAPTAEKAAYLLDAALASRSTDVTDEGRNSHFLFTLHVYQYRVEKSGKGGVAGGRSRLHLFDLGSCEKHSRPRDGTCLSLSALGNVILALFNGHKHVPYKDSKLTQLLREAMGSLTCRAAMIAHVSAAPTRYSETLATIQFAARIHRMRRKKLKYSGAATGDSLDDKVCRPYIRMQAVSEDGIKSGSSDPDYTSSSEQSCDTVIYLGNGGVPLSDREVTDNEGPPVSLPITSKMMKTKLIETETHRQHQSIKNQEDTSTNKSAANSSPSKQQSNTNQNRAGTNKNVAVNKQSFQASNVQDAEQSNTLSKGTPNQNTRKSSAKHRPNPTAKQDGSTQPAEQKTATKDSTKPQSDELWIDGPRFTKPKFDSRTLHQLQKEQWVDGPGMYGYMDDHKQNMIRRWVEEHSHHIGKQQKEVWIDFPKSAKVPQTVSESGDVSKCKSGDSVDTMRPRHQDGQKDQRHHRTCSEPDVTATVHYTEGDDDSASNSADVDETDNEENTELSAYDAELSDLCISHQYEPQDIEAALQKAQILLEYVQNEGEHALETIEVSEPHEPVPTQDSCLQVTEEDIFAACGYQEIENPLPEVDQESCEDRHHPLRILSEEDLNLPSSFTDSVSIDFERMSDKWRLLREIHARREKKLESKAFDELNMAVRSDLLTERLQRLAHFHDLPPQINSRAHETKSGASSPSSQPTNLPVRSTRLTLSEMLYGSHSGEEYAESDNNSIHSEPADLDFDKYDYKFNIKPMNGLKLEAFYNKIHKVPAFLEHHIKPIQAVSPTLNSSRFNLQKDGNKSDYAQLSSLRTLHRTDENHDHGRESPFSNRLTSLRHPDGSSNPNLNKHPSMSQLSSEQSSGNNLLKSSTSDLRSPGNGSSNSESEEVRGNLHREMSINLHINPLSPDALKEDLALYCDKELDTSQTGMAKSLKLSRLKLSGSSPEKGSKTDNSKNGKSPGKLPQKSSLNNSNNKLTKQQSWDSGGIIKNARLTNSKLAPHSSPTSSSSGTLTCCSVKPKDRSASTKHKHIKEGRCERTYRAGREMARSASSQSNALRERETAILDTSDDQILSSKISSPSSLPSPYLKVTRAQVVPHSSSDTSSDMLDTEQLLVKCTKVQQCSGTSSGYESMMRDSEGTPLSSSSQESGIEDNRDGEISGRKGSRKKGQNSGRRSQSVPAPSPTSPARCPHAPHTVNQQPVPLRVAHIQRWNGRVRKSDEEVCCTGLLCCRLMDFY